MSTSIDLQAVAEESLLANPATNFYLLIDHGGLPGLCSKLSKGSLQWKSLFDCGREWRALEVAPILILAGSQGTLKMPHHLFEWIEKEGAYTSSVIALSSPFDIEIMTKRLAKRLDVKLSNDMDAMLRFFDSRILEGLISTLSDKQLSSFLSVAEAWQFLDRCGNLVKIDSAIAVVDDCFLPLGLVQEQECRLVDLSEADQVLNIIRSSFPELERSRPLQYDFVRRQIEDARNSGVDSVFKYSLYIIVRILKGKNFFESAQGLEFLNKLKKDEFDFSENLSFEDDSGLMAL